MSADEAASENEPQKQPAASEKEEKAKDDKTQSLEWDDLGLSAKFYSETDQDRVEEEYYSLGVDLEFTFDAPKGWDMRAELDAAVDRMDLEELWGRYKAETFRLKIGMYENEILLEDQFSHKVDSFVTDNLVRERMKLNGWYSSSSYGIKLYEDAHYAHVFFQPTGREIQANIGWYHPFKGKKTYLGGTAVYYNYLVHNLWVGGEGFTNDHNFLFSASVADLSLKTFPVFYKLDVTCGNNLIDPIGFIHFPSEGDVNWFLGSDLLLGYPLGDDDFLWTPALNLSLIMQDLEHPDAWSSYARMGHQLAWHETYYFRMEAGVEINTHFDSYEHADPELITELEALWGVSIEVRL